MRFQTAALLVVSLAAACSSTQDSFPKGWGKVGTTRGYHDGPKIVFGPTGTGRYAEALLGAYDDQAAMTTVAFADRYYREPGNDGFEATIDHLLGKLEDRGFGTQDGYELRVIETELSHPAWTPVRAALTLIFANSATQELHQFCDGDDKDRTMLPANAPAASVEGAIARTLDELDAGEFLVTDRPLGSVLGEADKRGAAAVLSSYLMAFNHDPTGRDRHLDAIHYGGVAVGTTMPVAHISPRTHALLTDGKLRNIAKLRFEAEVRLDERSLRTVVASIVGSDRPHEVVTLVAHVQEPGANDNASGVGGMLEAAITLQRAIEQGLVERPRRTIAFVWGDEVEASRIFLDHTEREPIVGISADMIGQSLEETGAVCLLERGPDPGALTPLPPDEHTAWGAGKVNPDHIIPSGLALIARNALVDVGIVAGGWQTREHPWEGGSDHDVFLARGIPAILIWHFTDFAYHTSLDRMSMVDPRELQLTAVSLLTTACGVADARPEDMKRYVDGLNHERYERQGAQVIEGAPEEVAEQWGEWSSGARRWLAALCNGTPLPNTRAR